MTLNRCLSTVIFCVILISSGLLSDNAQSQTSKEWYVRVYYEVSSYVPEWDCNTKDKIRVVSNVVKLSKLDHGVYNHLRRQFVNHLYESHRELFDELSGYALIRNGGVIYGTSKEDLEIKIARGGILKGHKYCFDKKRVDINLTSDFVFLEPVKGQSFNEAIGGKKKYELLKSLFNKK